MKTLQIQLSITMTNEVFESKEVQRLIYSIKSGEARREIKKEDPGIKKVICTYNVIR